MPRIQLKFPNESGRIRGCEAEDVSIRDVLHPAEQRLDKEPMERRGCVVADARGQAGFHRSGLPVLREHSELRGHDLLACTRRERTTLPTAV